MGVVLDTPVAPPSVEKQAVTRIHFEFPHSVGVMDKPNIDMAYEVTTWDANGNEYNQSVVRSILMPDWPTAFKLAVKGVYESVEQDAQNQGLIGAGTPEEL